MDFENYKNLRDKRREGSVTEQEIGEAITDIKNQISKEVAELAALIEASAEAGALRRLAQMTNGDWGDSGASVAEPNYHGLQQAGRRLQKLLYWQKKTTIGLGADKTLPGYHNPYAYSPFDDPFGDPYGDEPDDIEAEADAEAQAMLGATEKMLGAKVVFADPDAEDQAFKTKLADDMAAMPAPKPTKDVVCHNCGFATNLNPCKICGNTLS